MSDVVLGIILHGFALVCVAVIIWGGFVETKRAEADYAARRTAGR